MVRADDKIKMPLGNFLRNEHFLSWALFHFDAVYFHLNTRQWRPFHHLQFTKSMKLYDNDDTSLL